MLEVFYLEKNNNMRAADGLKIVRLGLKNINMAPKANIFPAARGSSQGPIVVEFYIFFMSF